MPNTSKHPSDEEILRWTDHELSARHSERLQQHLELCPKCRDRQVSIQNRLQALNNFYNAEPIESRMVTTASRIRLQQRLAEDRSDRSSWHGQASGFRFRLPAVAAMTLVFIGLAVYSGSYIGKFQAAAWNSTGQMLIPNHSLTPGAVRSVTLNEVCSSTDADLDPRVSPSIETAVLREYGLPSDTTDAQKYQIDYLVNPQLGGTDDIKNLWPQPYSNKTWNAHAKDVLEQHLHRMVCNRKINLAVAQQEITQDWIAAYRKYVGREGS